MTKHPFRFTFFMLMCLALPLTAVEFDAVVLEAVEVADAPQSHPHGEYG